MLKIIISKLKSGYSFMRAMRVYLKGVVDFSSKKYESAAQNFEKAIKISKSYSDEAMFCQFYGQTLLALRKIDEAFFYLSKAYTACEEINWKVTDRSSYHLMEDTLKALGYIEKYYKLRIDNADYEVAFQKLRGRNIKIIKT